MPRGALTAEPAVKGNLSSNVTIWAVIVDASGIGDFCSQSTHPRLTYIGSIAARYIVTFDPATA